MIEICGLCKSYGQIKALDHLSLTINPGEVFGLLGPNGAGKTTTFRLLTTLAKPTAGKVFISGQELNRHSVKVKKEFGIVPQQLTLDVELTAWENLVLHGMLHKIPSRDMNSRIKELLALVELENRAQSLVNEFSGGMKRRLMIARAMMQMPSILFLDEPTAGLDPQVRRQIWDLLRRLNSQGVTVLLTTHYIEEAEQICSRVGILTQGKLIALGTPDELKARVGKVVVEVPNQCGTEYRVFENRETAIRYIAGLDRDALIRESSLEDVFIELTGRKVGE